MSRRYDMHIEIKGLKEKEHLALVEEAITHNWNASYVFLDPDKAEEAPGPWKVSTGGEGSLCGGETEEEFASAVAGHIWDALGYYAPVSVIATYLEDLPCEAHCMEEEEYADYLKRKEKS